MSHWEEKYRAKTIPWNRGAVSPALLGWIEAGALPPGRVLIPGCGRGHEAVELARRGFQVTALDIAPTALENLAAELAAAGVEAERVCVEAERVCADALAWQPSHPFDAIYEQTCLCALDPEHWAAYEQQLFAWLRPGGKLFALFMQTERADGPPFHCALPDMHALFATERWQWPDETPGRVAHPIGLFEFAAVLTRRG